MLVLYVVNKQLGGDIDMFVKMFIKQAPLIGTAASFADTAIKVYNSTTPTGAIKCAVKGIVIDCTPTVIKYPDLCSALLCCSVATVTTGSPLCASAACFVGEEILEQTLKQ